MAELANKAEDLDSEQPSTLKESFQRWLIVAGTLITLLFVYLFLVLSGKDDEEMVDYHDEVPQQVQDGEVNQKNAAIEVFQRKISDQQFDGSEKIKTPLIHESYLPRQKEVKTLPDNISELQKKQLTGPDEQSSYQKYLEKEEMRAFQSLSAKDSLGDDSGFYDDEASVEEKLVTPKSKTFYARQNEIQKKIDTIGKYQKGVAEGSIKPGSMPLVMTELSE